MQDFDFKIIHQAKAKHGNVYVFSHNPINLATKDEDFVNEVQDTRMLREMGIHSWIRRRCLEHQEIVTFRLEIPQIFMMGSKEHDAKIEIVKGQVSNGALGAIETS